MREIYLVVIWLCKVLMVPTSSEFFVSVILLKQESFLFKGLMIFCDFSISEWFSLIFKFNCISSWFSIQLYISCLTTIFATFFFFFFYWVLCLIFNYRATNILDWSHVRDEKTNENTNFDNLMNLYLVSNLFLIAS